MKRLLAAATILSSIWGLTSPVSAEPANSPDYTLTVTPQELGTIGTALADRPFKDVNSLVQKLNNQIATQEQARAKAGEQAKKAAGPKDELKPENKSEENK